MKPILVNDQFSVDYKIGQGGFGLVYAGKELKTDRPVALKLFPSSQDTRSIWDEAAIYAALAGGPGIPDVFWSGTERDYFVLAYEQLGPCLEDLLNYCNRRFSLKTLLLLADQAIARLAFIHRRGYVHRDVKPENLLMGLGTQGNTLYMIDFGLAREHCKAGECTSLEGRIFGGTLSFASINNHKGKEQSWGDDLESLGYVLIYCARGSLPWDAITDDNALKQRELILQKKLMPVEDLCGDLPGEFASYLSYARSRKYNQKPDYAYLRRLFRRLFDRRGFKHDHVYDWTEKLFHELQAGGANE